MLSGYKGPGRRYTGLILSLVNFHVLINLFQVVTSATSALKGKNFSCCLLTQYPSTYADPNSPYNFSGMGIDYLKNLKNKLGFECTSMTNFPGMPFTDFVDQIHNCSNVRSFSSEVCQCELGTSGWLENSYRYGKVHFITPFVQDNFQIITHKSNTSRSSGKGVFFLAAFSYTVWIAIFGLILCFSTVKMFDVKFDPIQKSSKPLSKAGIYQRTKKVRNSLRSVGREISESVSN